MRVLAIGIEQHTRYRLQSRGVLVVQEEIRSPRDIRDKIIQNGYDAVIIGFHSSMNTVRLGLVSNLRSNHARIPLIGFYSSEPSVSWEDHCLEFLGSGGDHLIDSREPEALEVLISVMYRAVLRTRGIGSNILTFCCSGVNIGVNFSTQSVTVNKKSIRLSAQKWLLLEALAMSPGTVKSRESLIQAAYLDGGLSIDSDRSIDSGIKFIRRNLRALHVDSQNLIQSMYGLGYRIPGEYALWKRPF